MGTTKKKKMDGKRKETLPKGFLTQHGKPTMNALISYFIYLKHLPPDWDMGVIHMGSIFKVREYFGFDHGFDVMIYWGINLSCSKSRSSDGRYLAMSLAYHDAKGMIGQGYVYTELKS